MSGGPGADGADGADGPAVDGRAAERGRSLGTRFVDFFVSDKARRRGDDYVRSARHVAATSSALLVAGPTFAIIYLLLGAYPAASVLGVASTVGLLVVFLLRWTGSVALTANLATANLFALLTYLSLTTGGIDTPAMLWVVIVPLLATVLHNTRSGAIWTGLVLLQVGAVYGLDRIGWVQHTLNSAQLETLWLLGLIGVITLGFFSMWLYERAKREIVGVVRQRNQALEEAWDTARAASRAKDEFLANVSHEIRTPMNAVIGMTDLLRQTDLTAEQREFADTIHSCSGNLLAIIDDILDFSKMEAGRLELHEMSFDLRQVIDDVVELYQGLAQERRLDIGVDVDDEIPHVVAGDAGRIWQVLSNLVNNAIKFTEAGSVHIHVRALDDDPLVRFEVQDSGIGIPRERRDALFEPFSQVDGSLTRRYGGTGLGLAICRNLVERMGGSIGLLESGDEGSTFAFDVPLPPATSISEARPERRSSPLPRIDVVPSRKVLVVEDNPVNRQVIHAMLDKLGHRARIVRNGAEALVTLDEERFDVVLMDCQMPVLDGYAATRALRSKESASTHVPVIAMTAHALPGERERCLAAGMDEYVTKPIGIEQLQRLISAIPRRARPTPAQVGVSADLQTAPESPLAAALAAPATPADASPIDATAEQRERGAEHGEPTIDLSKLAALRGNDPGGLARLIDLFLEDTPSRIADLERALERGDLPACAAEAHTLKGSTAYFGAAQMKSLCGKLEEAARDDDAARARTQLDALVGELVKVERALALEGARDEALPSTGLVANAMRSPYDSAH